MATNRDLAKIHIAKKDLGMDDATYRAMLHSVAGVSSSRDLTVMTSAKVLAHLQRCGWKPKSGHGKRPVVTAARKKQLNKIEALLADAGRPWDYLTKGSGGRPSMLRRLAGVDQIEWSTSDGLKNVIAALSIDAERRGA
ncbi:gp16 family protein [Jeongeupia chitinilytica]|uniref:GemA protein n=1 Tax=Jeongeupia chitinilytica TaxID=1041641 RepID=A0ABQ3H303_9NEIS|nr:regulatory protein GemA [Jeongeupia chitinilytica]GHD63787.1 GemA protein [Jeongeupia chitinilytica]